MICIISLPVYPVMVTFFSSSTAVSTCDREDLKRVQVIFTNCTIQYKTEYNLAVPMKKEEVQKMTCKLVENIVETCGDEWRQCFWVEDVRRMKDMQVESLLHKNRGAAVDMEQCGTVSHFR